MENTLVANVVGVLQIVGVSKGKSACVGGGKGGSGVGIGSDSVGSGWSLSELVLLRRPCQLPSTGFRHGAAVEVGGLCFVFGKGEVGWFGGRKGFGSVESGSLSSK